MKTRFLFLAAMLLATASTWATTFFPSRTDFRDEQIYFVMTTRFYDGDPSNNTQCWDNQSRNAGDPAWRGDFKGLIEKLDYIKALGFTAIWITPVVENASGYDYHGYHAADFSKVDHRYESEDVDFQSLIDAAHARGIKIILDIVLNHCGNFGEANLCKLFNRDWNADQSSINDCMVPYTQSEGGKLPDNYVSMAGAAQYSARLSQMKNTTGVNYDTHNYWHHYGNFNWDEPNRWFAQIAGDCVDLNTENPAVYNYLIQCYTTFIRMGVDGFRIDTGGHIPRLTFNKAFIPAFISAGQESASKRGGTPFYMFAEVCARYSDILYRGQACLSPFYYTWAESRSYSWDTSADSWNSLVEMEGSGCTSHPNWAACWQQGTDDGGGLSTQPTSQNALLNGNDYHTPDYSDASGLHVIDFPVHWNFASASGAWNTAKPSNDQYYNDATWNVVYVDSHDYAPDEVQQYRFNKGQDVWAENLSLMYTYRGIPCVYYGSEVEFQKGKKIDDGTNIALKESGRAYFGGYIKGTVQTTDFAEYNSATGNMAVTLGHPLARHIQRLSQIRMAVPALRKGQYSREGCSGSFAFKRRYTDATTDSYALVCISGNATFTGILNGTYTDCVTGDVKTVTNGSLSVSCSGKGNLRVYVLTTDKTAAPGKIGEDGKYIYATSSVNIPDPVWDGTEMELTEDEGGGSGTTTDPIEPCLTDANEHAVFFQRSSDFGKDAYCYIWHTGTGSTVQVCGGWPGQKAQALGNDKYKFTVPVTAGAIDSSWKIIWNDGGGNQTPDLNYRDQYLYTGANKGSITATSPVTAICELSTLVGQPQNTPRATKILRDGQLLILRDGKTYTATGVEVE
jgi:glycosidase